MIVNELGEVGIDHHLLRRVDERTVLLANGCVCCTMRGDLGEELLDLLGRRQREGRSRRFGRVVLETTGLADPAPILATLVSEPVVQHHYELGSVVTTVDALNGMSQLEREPESLRQGAAADRLVVTKTDLVERSEIDALEQRLRALNPAADRSSSRPSATPTRSDCWPKPRRTPDVAVPAAETTHDVRTFTLVFDEQLDWTAFGIWLTMLLQARGEDILRVKGLLDVGGPGPVVLNGVQHVVHRPVHLDDWPDGDRRSSVVFIGRGIEREPVESSLLAFNRAAERSTLGRVVGLLDLLFEVVRPRVSHPGRGRATSSCSSAGSRGRSRRSGRSRWSSNRQCIPRQPGSLRR